MVSIAVIGPGAIGGTLAGWMAQNPAHALTLCVRTPFEGLEVETPSGLLTADPRILSAPDAAQPVDWVLVATKTYDVAATRPWLERLVGPRTRVAVVQNGVEHVARFAAILPGRTIVPVVVDLPAQRRAPGRMIQQRRGWVVVPEGEDGADFVALLAGSAALDVSAVADWTSRAWAKLCLNCAGAVSTLTMRSTGPVWSPEIEAMVRGLVEECAAVARAEGAVIDPAVIETVVEGARTAPEGAGHSMYVDRLMGRPMEIDARNGVIVRLGRKHGIATPMNSLFVALLEASGSPWVQR